ncbi:hypothetical protein LTR64_008325 [Lithohypha guttulata]|uniref:uncharacterized protein n=1 Tax=Lithohypha guttulata TaxID=1690604 RepID=UPI002DDE50AC|nr:hypothetical protein LTR51_008477 [Lithohypha guttulata]
MLHKEISDIKCGLDYPSSDEEADPPEPGGADGSKRYHHHQGFLFGYSSLMHDMLELRPSPSRIFIIWEIFKDNVDPVMKLLHVPTVNHMITKAAVNPGQLSKAAEALFYSICFAAVVSMKDDQCDQLLGGTKDTLTDKYRFAVEQALARASFLNSSNLMVLQALALFLTVVKFNDTSRSIWCLAALALQQAQSQGLHRDPTNFKIPPFETEMRRRLWWHIYLQDARAAEDYGADPVSQQIFYDTRMPLNVNDNDLVCDMTEPCAERIGATDMTLCLVRFELANMQRKLRIMTSAESDDQKRNSIKEKEKLIDAEHQRMQETYFRHCDPNVPILWVASTIGKLILAKMWLFIHHPRLFQGDPSKNADDLREQVFCTSVEVIVFGSLLEKGKHTSKWSWLFHTYNQWHAVAYVLSELCHKPPGPEYDRAWAAVEAVYDKRMMEYPRSQRGVLWRPLRLMYGRAKTRRTQLVNSTSPDSNTDTNRTASADDNNVDDFAPTDGNGAENWLDSNPYMNALTESGDAFDFNINNQSFSQGGTMGSNLFGLPAGQANLPPKIPMDTLPFSWNLGVADYFDDFPMQIQQTGWTPQTQQEWH